MLTAHAQFSPPQQPSSRGRSRTRHSSEAMGGREVMRYDERGLVTIFVKWRGNSPQRNLSVLVSHLLKVRRPVLTVSLSLSLPPFLSSSPPLPPSLPQNKILHNHVATVEEPAQLFVRKRIECPSTGTA